jgi:hypothetical protein
MAYVVIDFVDDDLPIWGHITPDGRPTAPESIPEQ